MTNSKDQAKDQARQEKNGDAMETQAEKQRQRCKETIPVMKKRHDRTGQGKNTIL